MLKSTKTRGDSSFSEVFNFGYVPGEREQSGERFREQPCAKTPQDIGRHWQQSGKEMWQALKKNYSYLKHLAPVTRSKEVLEALGLHIPQLSAINTETLPADNHTVGVMLIHSAG